MAKPTGSIGPGTPAVPPGIALPGWLTPTPAPVAPLRAAPGQPASAQSPKTANPASTTTPPAANTDTGLANPQYQTTFDASAIGQMYSDLTQLGMTSADATAAQQWFTQMTNAQTDPGQMLISAYQQPWFQNTFPGIVAQIKNGDPPMSTSSYINFVQGVRDFESSVGLPKGFISGGDIGTMVANNWTYNDFTNRVGMAFADSAGALSQNPEAASLLDQWYGIKPGSGALAAFFLDPKNTVQFLENATVAAKGGASLKTAGFTNIPQDTLFSLAAHGVTADQIASTAQGAAGSVNLTKAAQGNASGQGPLSTADFLAASLGGVSGETSAQAQQKVEVASGTATGAFKGGGGPTGQGQPGTTPGTGFGAQ